MALALALCGFPTTAAAAHQPQPDPKTNILIILAE